MPSLFKSLFTTVVLIAAAPSLVHAEQFDTAYSDDGRYIESAGSANRTALAMLETTEPPVTISATSPAAANGCPRLTRIAGQATPSTLSGRPRLMNAR